MLSLANRGVDALPIKLTDEQKSQGDKPQVQSQEVQQHGDNLISGVVGTTGEVVDDTGKTIGKITEGTPLDLVGSTVTATGNVVGTAGGVVGKALPLGDNGEPVEPSSDSESGGPKSGFSLMGAAKGVKGVVDTVDGTVQAVPRTLSLLGNLTDGLGKTVGGVTDGVGSTLGGVTDGVGKTASGDANGVGDTVSGVTNGVGKTVGGVTEGVGNTVGGLTGGLLGGDSKDGENQLTSPLNAILGSAKPESDDEKKQQTEQAKQDLFEVNDKTQEVAPVDLKDATAATTDSDEAQNTPGETVSSKADNVKDDAEKAVDDKAGDAKDKTDDTVEGAKEKADDTVEGAKDTAEDAKDKTEESAEDVKDKADDTVEGAKDTSEDAQDKTEESAEATKDKAEDTVDDVKDKADESVDEPSATDKAADTAKSAVPEEAEKPVEDAKDKAEEAADDVKESAEDAKDKTEESAEDAQDKTEESAKVTKDNAEDTVDDVKQTGEDAKDKTEESAEDAKDKTEESAQDAKVQAEDAADDAQDGADKAGEAAPSLPALDEDGKLEQPFKSFPGAEVAKDGRIVFEDRSIGQLPSEIDNAEELVGKKISPEGDIIGSDNGTVLGQADLKPEIVEELVQEAKEGADKAADEATPSLPALDEDDKLEQPFKRFPGAQVGEDGRIIFEDRSIGQLPSEIDNAEELVGKKISPEGDIIGSDNGTVLGQADLKPEIVEELVQEAKEGADKAADEAVPSLPALDDNDKLEQPFKRFPGAQVGEDGRIIFEDRSIGKLPSEIDNADELVGKKISPEGDIIGSDNGTVLGQADLKPEIVEELVQEAKDGAEKAAEATKEGEGEEAKDEETKEEEVKEDEEPPADLSSLKNCKVNKAGNVVNDKGEAIGRIAEGVLKLLVGRKVDENGLIWNDSGKQIGKAELIPENEREDLKDPAPFEDFPEAVVESNGHVTYKGEIVGRVIEGDAKRLKGKHVDDDGDIQDRSGNVIGKAERWEPEPEEVPEPEPEVEVDNSSLAGKRVNKAGNIVDSHGDIYGRLVEGDPKKLAGRMCDKKGNVLSESGDIVGRAEVVPEGEREGRKDGPFAELQGCTVAKGGKVLTQAGDVVGRVISGDAVALVGRSVDEDGDILDRNGNSLGRAERWEEPEEPVVEKKKGPMAGRRVNREGNVVDEDGNLIGKLTSGELNICAGSEIDDDGDVYNSKGSVIGHCNLLADIPEPEAEPEPEPEEPEESAEEKKAREEAETDRKLAKSLGSCIEQCLDRVRPTLKMITSKIEKAERTPKDELDEEQLVKDVKPLIEEAGKVLSEVNGTIRALDPDGRIQRNAKHKASTRDASPEEYHLADVLKELTGTVTETVDGAKRKIEDMPHAKKELNPLWGLLTEPLFQILAAVGLLLTGVLGIVGRLLNGLGLGGLVDGLLGSLGLSRLLDGLGLGSLMGALTGKNQRKNK